MAKIQQASVERGQQSILQENILNVLHVVNQTGPSTCEMIQWTPETLASGSTLSLLSTWQISRIMPAILGNGRFIAYVSADA